MSNGQKKPHKIVIVGGGHSAFATLEMIVEKLKKSSSMLPLEIEILESGMELCGGLAWDKDNLKPFHLVNSYLSSEESLNYHEARLDRPKYFQTPLPAHRRKNEISRAHYAAVRKIDSDSFLPTLADMGISVKLALMTTVTGIEKKDGKFALRTGNGENIEADFVVLANGHWQSNSKTNENPGVYASPWPASDLEKASLNNPIAVMGSSLSSVDAALTLAHAAGTFEDAADAASRKKGYLTFHPNRHSSNFKLVMYSPHGMLPSVLGHEPDEMMDSVSDEILKDIGNKDPVSLDTVFNVMRKHFVKKYDSKPVPLIKLMSSPVDLISHALNARTERKLREDKEFQLLLSVLKDDTLDLDAALNIFYQHSKSKGLSESFTHQYDQANESLNSKTAIPVQAFLRAMDRTVESCYHRFSAEDQERFMRDIRPVYTKLAYGVMHSNARQIKALIDGGYLEVRATGAHSSLGTVVKDEKTLPGAEIRYTDASGKEVAEYYPTVVKAYGDDPGRLRYSSPLMRSVYGSGIGREMLTPFQNQSLGEAEFAKEKQSGIPGNTRLIDGVYYRSGGTLAVDPASFELLPPIGKTAEGIPNNIYALGPLVTGQTPLLQGVGPIYRSAIGIVDSIEHRIQTERFIQSAPVNAEGTAVLPSMKLENGMVVAFIDPNTPPSLQFRIQEIVAKAANISPENVLFADIATMPPELEEELRRKGAKNRGPAT